MSWNCDICGSYDREGHEECNRIRHMIESKEELQEVIEELNKNILRLIKTLEGKE